MESLEDLEAAAFDNALEENSLALSELSPREDTFPVREAELSEPSAEPTAARAVSTEQVAAHAAPAAVTAEVLSSTAYAQALASAVDRCSKKPRLSLPWESDSLAGIFGQNFEIAQLSAPSFPSALIPENFLHAAVASSSSAAPWPHKAAKCTNTVLVLSSSRRDRTNLLFNWTTTSEPKPSLFGPSSSPQSWLAVKLDASFFVTVPKGARLPKSLTT